jgi:hypothetical protein
VGASPIPSQKVKKIMKRGTAESMKGNTSLLGKVFERKCVLLCMSFSTACTSTTAATAAESSGKNRKALVKKIMVGGALEPFPREDQMKALKQQVEGLGPDGSFLFRLRW